MLTVIIPGAEYWNDDKEEFVYSNEQTIIIEHSLAAIAEWEAKYRKPFLETDKTVSETIDYIRMMTVSDKVSDDIYNHITQDNIDQISEYMESPMTATWFKKTNNPPGRDVITAEIVYYWMIVNQIPFECQYWHFNRLMTLIRVCGEKNKAPSKMSKNDLYKRNNALNAARKKKLKTRG